MCVGACAGRQPSLRLSCVCPPRPLCTSMCSHRHPRKHTYMHVDKHHTVMRNHTHLHLHMLQEHLWVLLSGVCRLVFVTIAALPKSPGFSSRWILWHAADSANICISSSHPLVMSVGGPLLCNPFMHLVFLSVLLRDSRAQYVMPAEMLSSNDDSDYIHAIHFR